MSIVVDAVFQNGMFKPTQPVELPENEPVRLQIATSSEVADALAWLNRLRVNREKLREKYGEFSDSALEIAEERYRDV